jgi:ubiquinone/menaquinone biosynthesis C-methylase UbiE
MKPDLERSREKYRSLAATYDRRVQRSEAVRREAVERLALRPGEIALDVGCGTGLSFPLLVEGVGAEGRVIGVEASADMLAKARERVREQGWPNVTLIEAAAEDAKLDAEADAVLFHFVHDISQSEAALQNVFGQVKDGGRVAAAGGKWAPWWAAPVNAYMWWLSRQYVTTYEGYREPWRRIRRFVPDLRVESRLFGAVYLAWGTARRPKGGGG